MSDGVKKQPSRRGRKVNINFAADPHLVASFRESNQHYVGRLSACFSAAMAMWLAAHPEEQGKWLKSVLEAEVNGEVRTLLKTLQQKQIRAVHRQGDKTQEE